MATSMRNRVEVIAPTVRSVQNGARLTNQVNARVAAYCRVSTGDESQQTSYTMQKQYYEKLIKGHEGWAFAGIYADEAMSGTSRAHRVEFNRMMEDAQNGKVDYIVTKSISRFARNTLDTLTCVRNLQRLSPPVGIFFEKENIDTLDAKSELVLTILSALAQDESRSISDNIKWSIQKKFQEGKPQINLSMTLGYTKGVDGEWVIIPEEAETIRFIFEQFVKGNSGQKISAALNRMGRMTSRGNPWCSAAVYTILRNEKYVGDCEMQKNVTVDFLSHKCVPNNGILPKYYVTDHHVGIISRSLWDETQMLLQSKDLPKQGPAKAKNVAISSFSRIRCGNCGDEFKRVIYNHQAAGYTDERCCEREGLDPAYYSENYTYAYPLWRCMTKMGEPKKGGRWTAKERAEAEARCPSHSYHEESLKQSFMEMLYRIKRDYEENGADSELVRQFQLKYKVLEKKEQANNYSMDRIDILQEQIDELEKTFLETTEKLVTAIYSVYSSREVLGEILTGGKVDMDKLDAFVQSMEVTQETEEVSIYARLLRDLRVRVNQLRVEMSTLEASQGSLAGAKRNFEFFLKCLKELPETNLAGMKLNVNGRDVDGSLFVEADGSVRKNRRNHYNIGRIKLTGANVENAPDMLEFQRSLFETFIESGTATGDIIVYKTRFGVELTTTGNTRKLACYAGFRKCDMDGSIQIIMAPWDVIGKKLHYSRKERKYKKRNPMTEHVTASVEEMDATKASLLALMQKARK